MFSFLFLFLSIVSMLLNDKFCRWIEFWQRKRRQYMCGKQTWSSNTFITNTHETIHKNKYDCQNINDDIREALCSNKNNARLIEVRSGNNNNNLLCLCI